MKTHLFLLILLAFTAVLAACGDNTPPVAVTVGEICQQESGTRIVAEGQLALPSALICEGGQCKINFYDDTGSILVELVTTENPGSNNLKLPPNQYSAADISFVLADGAPGDASTRVKITGPVRRPSEFSCYLDAHAVERP
ncbi:MAG TPA: hypothetical protein PLD25_21670 [Chloroflexota bacterium]|nr:hypothetical protein [Chloroflexota bacterium]